SATSRLPPCPGPSRGRPARPNPCSPSTAARRRSGRTLRCGGAARPRAPRAGADEEAADPEVDDLAKPLGAVLGRAGHRELVDQLVRPGFAGIELDLAGSAAGATLDAAARRSVHRLHRLDRLLILGVLGLGDVRSGLCLEAGEARVGHDEAEI